MVKVPKKTPGVDCDWVRANESLLLGLPERRKSQRAMRRENPAPNM